MMYTTIIPLVQTFTASATSQVTGIYWDHTGLYSTDIYHNNQLEYLRAAPLLGYIAGVQRSAFNPLYYSTTVVVSKAAGCR